MVSWHHVTSHYVVTWRYMTNFGAKGPGNVRRGRCVNLRRFHIIIFSKKVKYLQITLKHYILIKRRNFNVFNCLLEGIVLKFVPMKSCISDFLIKLYWEGYHLRLFIVISITSSNKASAKHSLLTFTESVYLFQYSNTPMHQYPTHNVFIRSGSLHSPCQTFWWWLKM